MEQQEKLTVLLIEPECYPKTIEIEPGLEPLQKAVGGWIEAVYPWEDKAAIIVNEEGKLDQLPLNRALRTEDGEIYDITAGNMLIVGLGEEDFSSLTKDQLAHYEKLFHQPEIFICLGGHLYGGRLPVHVRCLIDEAANIGQIPNLEKLVATIRSREISACLVLQARSQLKAIYKDNADTIIGNMDSQIFLGGSEPTTLKELNAALGKETIDSFNTSDTRGNSPSYGTNFQKLGHDMP